MTCKTFLTGLIGAPIAHSASPAMHEQAARDLGLRCHYQLIEIAGADREELRSLLDRLRRLGFAGVNVTFPYKEVVIDLLNELSPDAAAIGAVNTIVVRGDRLIGYNTDATGFARAAAQMVAESVQGSVALIGAGGAGKAIAFALVNLGVVQLRVFDAERAKAEDLAVILRPRSRVLVMDSVEDAMRGAVGLVNATPVGMLPESGYTRPAGSLARWVVGSGCRLLSALDASLDSCKGKRRARYDRARTCGVSSSRRFRTVCGVVPSRAEMAKAFDRVMRVRAE